jgi:osmoprotectant transport system permease protein
MNLKRLIEQFPARCLLVASMGLCAYNIAAAGETLRIGSKRFTESYILGEIVTGTAAPYVKAEHRQGLGSTAIVFEALKAGQIDVYPEYTGTIEREILKHDAPISQDAVKRELAALGIGIDVPLGFNDGYAIAMRNDDAERAGIRTLSDLARHADMRLGLSHEFLGRSDGWRGLAERYGLRNQTTGLDHGIAYEALGNRQIDAIDIYSTDARITKMNLRVLEDDLHYFPRYDAVLLYRLDATQRFPDAWRAIRNLQGRISAADMIGMNAAAEFQGESFAAIAASFLAQGKDRPAVSNGLQSRLFGPDLWRLTRQHVSLVLISVLLAALIGIPLGITAAFVPTLRAGVMAVVGLLQTVPSLALLAMLIPLLGTIGATPAIIALLLYALLPIVSNTCTAMLQIPVGLRQAALALGLGFKDRLLHIDIPLCMPMILTGIRTAAVINVGTATIAAFIGAGGYGERIAAGLALNDNAMLLAGAIPSAVLALLAQFVFEAIERLYLRRHAVVD